MRTSLVAVAAVLLTTLAGCESSGSGSLAGEISCGTGTCTDGQVCVSLDPGLRGDGGGTPSPATSCVTPSCTGFSDCSNDVACDTPDPESCANQVCNHEVRAVMGRYLFCRG